MRNEENIKLKLNYKLHYALYLLSAMNVSQILITKLINLVDCHSNVIIGE